MIYDCEIKQKQLIDGAAISKGLVRTKTVYYKATISKLHSDFPLVSTQEPGTCIRVWRSCQYLLLTLRGNGNVKRYHSPTPLDFHASLRPGFGGTCISN